MRSPVMSFRSSSGESVSRGISSQRYQVTDEEADIRVCGDRRCVWESETSDSRPCVKTAETTLDAAPATENIRIVSAPRVSFPLVDDAESSSPCCRPLLK